MKSTVTETSTNDLLLRGVIGTIDKESELLDYLPFMDVTGIAYR
jgi:hypothetical protein